MIYIIFADIIVIIHLIFILFVVTGGLLVIKWRKLIWAHVPAALWGALIEFTGWICPLTYLENDLRVKGGSLGYSSGFIEHYLIPIIYPAGLTHSIQIVLGIFVVLLNVTVYGWIIMHRKQKSRLMNL